MAFIEIYDDLDRYCIQIGPPIRLICDDGEWIIVAKPMLESFSNISRGWYDRHPDLPEPRRRIESWIEAQLIDWLPLAGENLQIAIRSCAGAIDQLGVLGSSATREGDDNAVIKLILRSSEDGKTPILFNMISCVIHCNPDATTLTVANNGTEAVFGAAILAMPPTQIAKLTFFESVDPRVIDLWRRVSEKPVDAPIKITNTEIIYKNQKRKIPAQGSLYELLFPGSVEPIAPTSGTESPAATAALMDDIEDDDEGADSEIEELAVDPKFSVCPVRFVAADLPAKAWVQVGEIFGAQIEWSAPHEAQLAWQSKCNPDDEPGVSTGNGWGYAGWHASGGIYLRYNAGLFDNEHCMRVVIKGDSPALIKNELDPTVSDYVPLSDPEKVMQLIDLPDPEQVVQQLMGAAPAPDTPDTEHAIIPEEIDSVEADLNASMADDDDEAEVDDDEVAEVADEAEVDDDEADVAEVDDEEDEAEVDDDDEVAEDDDDEVAEDDDDEADEADEDDDQTGELMYDMLACMDPAEAADIVKSLYVCFVGPVEPDSATPEKLIYPEPAEQKDTNFTIQSTMSKNNNKATTKASKADTIPTTEVAHMLCDLGMGLAAHFELETQEVMEYLDGHCEDSTGVNPNSAAVFAKVQEMSEDAADATITQEQFDEWFSSPSKGGLKMAELKEKAKELGLEITSKTKKDEIKEMMEALIAAEEDDDDDDEDEEEEEEEEEEDEEDTSEFKVYMEAEGAKGTNKFWEVTVDDCDMTTRYGKAGSDGQTSTKSYDDNEAAIKAAEKLIKTKEKAGYTKIESDECEFCASEEDEEECDESEEAEDSGLTTDQVTIWFLSPAKGGLKMAELKEKAEEYGVDPKGMKKDEIKEALLAMCGEESEDAEDSEEPEDSEEEEEAECQYTYTKGPQKGSKCTTKPKDGAHFCGKHKDCKAAKSESESEEEESPVKKGKGKGKIAIKPATSGKCLYVPTRGPQKGKQCSIKPKDSESFCAKHATTQQAVQYKANESPAAKKEAKKKASEDEEEVAPVAVKRNKDLKVWVVEGHNLVVKSPKNKTVTAYVTKKGTLSNTLTKAMKTLAEELGLEIA